MLMLLLKCQSGSHTLHCYTLLWAIGPLAFPLCLQVKGTQMLKGSFPLNHFPIRQAFSLCRGVIFPMGILQVFTGAAGRKEEWIFYHIKLFHSIFIVFFTSSVLFYSRFRESSYKALKGKETSLMSLTSEDASRVIKEVQLLKYLPSSCRVARFPFRYTV